MLEYWNDGMMGCCRLQVVFEVLLVVCKEVGRPFARRALQGKDLWWCMVFRYFNIMQNIEQ